MFVKDLQAGCVLDGVLVVREARLRAGRDGGDELRLVLGDRTGCLAATICEDVAAASEVATAGAAVRVAGCVRLSARHGAELQIESLVVAAPGSFDEAVLQDGPARSPALMEADLRELVATVQDPDLRRLLDAVLGPDAPTWSRYRSAPAAKRFHQAYRHGLLEHSLSVAQAVSAISATFGIIDRDVAVTGALLHDVGKLDAYAFEGDPDRERDRVVDRVVDDPVDAVWVGAIEMTDAGKLQGEIPLGYYRVRRLIDDIDGFAPQTAEAVLHIILSHHGSLEHGSPVVPCTREATLVHFCDNLGGRLGSFDRLEKELPSGERWSSFDRAIGSGAYFPEASPASRAPTASPAEPAACAPTASPAEPAARAPTAPTASPASPGPTGRRAAA